MPKFDLKENIKLSSYEEILGANSEGDSIKNIPIESLNTFKNHPFHVVDDEDMQELVESIKEKGVLSPLIARKSIDGGYEIISGHRRKRASELAGLKVIPVIVKDLDDDEATILMVDANIQREKILPSERAFSFRMKMNAMSHQGARTDLTSGQIVQKLTADEIGEKYGFSGKKVMRYVRLTELIPELLEKVDEDLLGFIPAVNISFVGKDEQSWINAVIEETSKKISVKESERLKEAYDGGSLDESEVLHILTGKVRLRNCLTLSEKELNRYFPEEHDTLKIKNIIFGLLEKWKEEGAYE